MLQGSQRGYKAVPRYQLFSEDFVQIFSTRRKVEFYQEKKYEQKIPRDVDK